MLHATQLHPDVQTLKQFHFLDFLSERQLELLARSLTLYRVGRRKRLLTRGDTADFSLLLLSGRVRLDDGAGGRQDVRAGNELAAGPIAADLPRRYDVVAMEDVTYLRIDNLLLRELRANEADPGVGGGRGMTTAVGADELMLERINADLEANTLRMPSLPDVAFRIGRALDDRSTDAHRIAALIQNDPAITAKLIWVANSSFYTSQSRPLTCADAVVRLGFRATYHLVLSLALREVFHTRIPILQGLMRALWRHSVKVSALCYLLAKHTPGFDPEHALLCGLLHDIGEVGLLAYMEEFPVLAGDERLLHQVLAAQRAAVGVRILQEWQFPQSLVTCVQFAEDWLRDSEGPPQYCDLVVVAQLQCARGTPRQQDMPALNTVPAFRKLKLGVLEETGDLEILHSAADQLALAESLLNE